jgi:oligopeptide/dipeptide ABC transporter ATP-binding protein
MSLLPAAARVEGGSVTLDGTQLPQSSRAVRRALRGRMAMIFQDSLSALDPVRSVGSQIAEVPRRIHGASQRDAWERAVELLRMVGIPDPARRAAAFPHQLSGGMRQRVVIAIALAVEPAVLLCDEPTTALDVTVQAQVLELLDELRAKLSLAIVFVSHDLAVVRQLCEDVCVMYTGRIVESGRTPEVLEHPRHPYTLGLLDAIVDLDDALGSPRPIPGALPDLERLPVGCSFHPRCFLATDECTARVPELAGTTDPLHRAACIHSDQVPPR